MTNQDDEPRSMSQLLQLLERKLDKYIENSGYVASLQYNAMSREGTDTE